MKNPIRKYKQTNSELMSHAILVYDTFLNDKADFTAKFSTFDDPFADNFLAAINDIKPDERDDWMRNNISLLVEQIRDEMELARRQVTMIFTYVRIAFSGDRSVAKAFGSGDVKKALNSYPLMINLLDKLYRQSELPDNKPALLAAGLTQADIDSLLAAKNSIDAAYDRLSDSKSARLVNTKTVIDKHNNLWSYLQKLSAGSKEVYYSEPAKRSVYNLNFGRKRNAKPSDGDTDK